MKDKKVFVVLMLILDLVLLFLLIIPSAKSLGNSNNETIEIVEAIEAAEYKRSVVFVPVAKSSYYIVILKDGSYGTVRANKKWFNDNFTSLGYPKDGKSVTVEGRLEELPFRVIKAIKDGYTLLTFSGLLIGDEAVIIHDEAQCIDLFEKSYAIKGIVAAILGIAIGVVCVLAYKNNWYNDSSLLSIVLVVCEVAVLLFSFHVILGR